MTKKITLILFSCALIGIMYKAFSISIGITSFTGSPGEVTCSVYSCHGSGNGNNSSGGLPDNAGGGSISILGISGTYTPGKLYHLTVRIKQMGCTKFGFNAETLNSGNGSAGTITNTLAGTFIGTGVGGSRKAISHGYSGTPTNIAGNGKDSFDFTFDWTAPDSSIGPIKIFAAGIAANVNGKQDAGDNSYKTSITINPDVVSIARILVSRSNFNFPSFVALANTVGNTQIFFVSGQSLTSDLSIDVSSGQFKISTSSSGPWNTNVALKAASGVVTGTAIYVQYTGGASGTQTGTVTVSGGGASSKTVALNGAVKVPAIGIPSPTSLDFGSIDIGSGNSASKSFSVVISNPINGTTFSCPSGYEITTTQGYNYMSKLTPYFTGFGATYTCYIRVKNPIIAGSLDGNLTITTPGGTTQNVALKATATAPTKFVLASRNNLKLFSTNPGTPSVNDSFTISGVGLTDKLVVTGTSKFEVSLSTTSGFGSSVSITPIAGNVASTTIYTRYNPSTAGLDDEQVIVSSTNAIDQVIVVRGVCFGSPADLAVSGTINPFSSTAGTPSMSQSFNISASNLSYDLTVSAPSNFEVSLSSTTGFTNNVSLSPVSGNISSTTIYIRYNPTAGGSHNGNIVVSALGASSKNISVSGLAGSSYVNSLINDKLISIYPNPSNGVFTINYLKPYHENFLSVKDALGKAVFSEKFTSNQMIVDLGNRSGGIYFIVISDEKGNIISTSKFSIKK